MSSDMLPFLLLPVMLFVAIRLPAWLERFAWYRSVINWQLYRRWTPCRHPHRHFGRAHATAADLPDFYIYACEDCGTVFLADTWANWEIECQRVSWWRRVQRVLPWSR